MNIDKVSIYIPVYNSEKTIEFIAGDEAKPIAYYFPPGILHGYKCIHGPMEIIYVTSEVYDLEDEVRVPKVNINKSIF